MKKLLLFLLISLSVSYICAAQPGRTEKMEAIFVAYVTKQLNLSSEEAQRFWPVYNDYADEIKKVRQENRNDELAFEEKALNIRKKYKPEFKKVLNDEERVNKVFIIDRNFREVLRREMMNRQKNKARGPNRPQPSN